jgi:hypothetical protein
MNTQNNWKTFLAFTLRVIIAHTLTYFIFGIMMSNVFDYGEVFKREVIRDYMLPIDEHNVLMGPFMQPVRGLIFAIGLWPLRTLLLGKKRGWLTLWGLLVTLGILSTPAAAPGSIEGMLYSKLPMWYHLIGYPEIMLQTLVFSIWLVWWERQSITTHEIKDRKQNPVAAEIIKALMTACFAYIGYAVGGLLLAFMANAKAAASGTGGIDIEAAGADFKMQFMFVVAFIINAIIVFWIAPKWQANRLTIWATFLLFWFIDATVPWLYQTIVFGSSFIPTVLLLGFFPAVIITLSIRTNYRKLLQRVNVV